MSRCGVSLSHRPSNFPAEADVIVEVEQVEPSENVLARSAELGEHLVEVHAALQIRWAALGLIRAPLGDLPGSRFGLGMSGDPFEDLAVAFAERELFLEVVGLDAGKLEEPLVERASEVVFAVLAGDDGAAFVEAAGKDDVAAEPHARAAGRTLCEIGCVQVLRLHFLVFSWLLGYLYNK